MDSFIVSARKYRPATFETIVGQLHITGTLKNAIKNNQLAQAFLFCGPRGVGKTTCARILAKTINCQNLTNEVEACGVCDSCMAFQNGNSFNVHELDAASNNSVEDIRSLIEQVRIPPQAGKYKVYIIDEVHMLSAQAFNAFLKTLEEPPSYAKFILATTEKHKILPTILSRCQIFDFNRIRVEDIANHLQYIAEKEEVGFDQDGLHLIAQKSDGGLRDALSMFDQLVSFSNKNLSYQAVIDNLNVLDYDYYFKITQAIQEEDSSKCLVLFDEILSNGFDGSHFISGLASHFRNLLVAKDIQTIKLLEVSKSIKERYLSQAEKTSQGLLLSGLNIANQCEIQYKTSRNQRLQVEIALLKMCHIAAAIQLTKMPLPTVEQSQEIKKKTNNTKHSVSSETPVIQEISKEHEPVSTEETKASMPAMDGSIAIDSNLAEPAEKITKPKLVIPKFGDIAINAHIPNLDSVFEEKKVDAEKDPEYIQGDAEEPFQESDFLIYWKSFAEQAKIENKINLYTLMTANEPTLRENYQVAIIIENQLQQQLLIESKIDLLNYLRQKLKNFKIDLIPVLQKTNVIRKPVTDTEKYQAMLSKNPLLDQFRKEFNLGFE
ncbi:DNA polymerase III subunit gamma/tau [Albibacterium bauzanense]|uniref:DNA polymerase III subunit gamma/tau n=1 Tax=Albibacterium bauzanense TaxID=653929 RepID=A0A4R1M778_9SPHI|nr:DNA polymerase III subunit gamma/tau [Albibacterium bauzanense]TCK85679.1 DNA polymerase-3 subunit gamma/tau [Albibacterium bauzanense]